MYCYHYKYYRDNIFILDLDILSKEKMQKSFLELKIFSSDGVPLDNADVRVVSLDGLNKYIINIDADGYYPVQIDDVKFYPNHVSKLNIKLISAFLKKQTVKLDQRINPPLKLQYNIQSSQESEVQPDEVREITMSLGMGTPRDSSAYLYAEKFANEVNKLSNGKMKMDLYTDAKLGTDRQMLQNILNDGNIDFIVQSTAPQADFMPKLSIFDMPIVYTNRDDLRNAINNEKFYEKIIDIYKKGGYKLLGFSDPLFRGITTNKEIHNIDDFKGIKIRTVQNKNYEMFWKSLGAEVVPLPISEIYTSLRHGFIDSTDSPFANIIVLKLYEMQKYSVFTYHLPYLLNLITCDKHYNSLSAAEKAIIDEAAVNATKNIRKRSDELFAERIIALVDNGLKLLALPDETKQSMRLKAKPVYEKIREIVGDDELINLYIGNMNDVNPIINK